MGRSPPAWVPACRARHGGVPALESSPGMPCPQEAREIPHPQPPQCSWATTHLCPCRWEEGGVSWTTCLPMQPCMGKPLSHEASPTLGSPSVGDTQLHRQVYGPGDSSPLPPAQAELSSSPAAPGRRRVGDSPWLPGMMLQDDRGHENRELEVCLFCGLRKHST